MCSGGPGLIDKKTGADRIHKNNDFFLKLVFLIALFWRYRVLNFNIFAAFS